MIINRQQGFSVLIATIALLLLAGTGATTLHLVSTQQEVRTDQLESSQAFGLLQAGIEYAKQRIDQGANPVVNNYPLAGGSFSVVANPAGGGLTVVGTAGSAVRNASLTTAFAGQCVTLDVSQAHSAGKNIVGLTLTKQCLTQTTITDWTFQWVPDVQEKSTQLLIQGDQLVTLFDDPVGYPSGRKIDALDFTLTKNGSPYPINKWVFNTNLPPGKDYTVTLHFGDGSQVTQSFLDPTPGGSQPSDPPADPGFTTPGDGNVVVNPNKRVTVQALCSEITYGAGGPKIPVKAWLGTDQVYTALYNEAAITGGESYTTTSGGMGTVYTVKANAKHGSFNATYDSNNTLQVKTLIDGSTPPPLAGFGGQKSVSACVAPYLNKQTGKVVLQKNQVLLLFELGVNMSQNPNSPAADFQDLVIVLTVG